MIGKCHVCGAEGKVYIASSTCGAMSSAYCRDCMKAGAEPYSDLVAYISLAGSKPEDINKDYLQIIDNTLKRLNISEEKFWQDVRNADF